MSLRRTWAIFMRYFYVAAKLDHLSDLLYWPAIDIFLWGVTTVWIQHHDNSLPDFALALLTGLIFWQVIWRGNYEVGVNLLYEFWNRNLVNLFSTPLKLYEWAIGIMMVGLFKIMISVLFGSLLVYLLYTLNIFTVGWAFFPFALLLVMAGWMFGFLAAGIVVYWGQRVQMLAWMTAYIFAPFSAVFYPVAALPPWAQKISWALPTTYIFEGMREVLIHQHFPLNYFLTSLGLSIVYLTLSFTFFKFMFEKSREKGLARLE